MITQADPRTVKSSPLKRVFDRAASHIFAFAVFAPIRAAVALLSVLGATTEAVVALHRKRRS